MKTTKENLVTLSLEMFSKRGFESVSMRDIAKAAGIKEASLYNHFENKKDLFNTVISYGYMHVTNYAKQNVINFQEDNYENIKAENLISALLNAFEFFFNDEKCVLFRRLLSIERYCNKKVAALYQEMFYTVPIKYFATAFSVMTDSGELSNVDPENTALEFYGPIYILLDTAKNLSEAKPLLKAHLKHFVGRVI